MLMDNVVTTSANPVTKPIGAETPTDALGVTKRMSISDPETQESDEPQYKNAELLRRLYVDRGLTQKEIADEIGCSPHTVYTYIKKYDISRADNNDYKDPDWLREKYHDEGLSMAETADLCGVSLHAVSYQMKRHGIERRSISASRSKGDVKKLHDANWLYEEYSEKERSTTSIADQLGVTSWTVSKWLRRHGIGTRASLSAKGEDNPNWAGGYERYYGASWRRQRRETVARDGGECVICGKEPVDVHHIRPFREFGVENHEEANALDNLVCLCRQHHSKWEGIPLRPEVVG